MEAIAGVHLILARRHCEYEVSLHDRFTGAHDINATAVIAKGKSGLTIVSMKVAVR